MSINAINHILPALPRPVGPDDAERVGSEPAASEASEISNRKVDSAPDTRSDNGNKRHEEQQRFYLNLQLNREASTNSPVKAPSALVLGAMINQMSAAQNYNQSPGVRISTRI